MRSFIISHAVESLIVLTIFLIFLVHVLQGKEIVILAGPHETGLYTVRNFFDKFATDYDSSRPARSLNGWKWPTLLGQDDLDLVTTGTGTKRSSIFKLLFQEQGEKPIGTEVEDAVMAAIQNAYDTSENGIIIGDDKFDKVGDTPMSKVNALEIIENIVDTVGAQSQDVTIVLLYKQPRMHQWANIWNLQSSYDTYEDFLCKRDEAFKRYEYLETAMNPFQISRVYAEYGYKVVMIDEEGTKEKNQDISHAIACNILEGVTCDKDGWISDLREETTELSTIYDMTGLDIDQLDDLELLFRKRDCVYKSDLERSYRFQTVNQLTMWSTCLDDYDQKYREKLMDTSHILNLLQSQKDCNEVLIDTSEFLPHSSGNTQVVVEESSDTGIQNFLISFLVLLSISAVVLGMFLIQSRYRKGHQGEMDGIFNNKNAPTRDIFRKRIFSDEGSTGSSSDEETARHKNTAGSKPGYSDGASIDYDLLCKACKLVRIDPKCPFCNGGKPTDSTTVLAKSVLNGKMDDNNNLEITSSNDEGNNVTREHYCLSCMSSLQGPNPGCPDCGGGNPSHIINLKHIDTNNWLSDDSSSMTWDNNVSAVVGSDGFEFGTGRAKVVKRESPGKNRRESKSRVFKKLKELALIKNGTSITSRGNLQFERDDEKEEEESVVDFTETSNSLV